MTELTPGDPSTNAGTATGQLHLFAKVPDEIVRRFVEEQDLLKKYSDLLARRLTVEPANVARAVDDLRHRSFLPPHVHVRYLKAPLSHVEILSAQELLAGARQSLHARLLEVRKMLEDAAVPEDLISLDSRSTRGILVEYFLEDINGILTEAERDEAKAEALRHYLDQQDLEGPTNEEFLVECDKAWKCVEYLAVAREMGVLESVDGLTDDLNVLASAGMARGTLNVARQAFLLLVAAFDAATFDLVRAALRRSFFRLTAALAGKGRKLDLGTLNSYTSFDDLREKIAEEQLRSRYLRELLLFLKTQNVALVDESSGANFAHLIELVLRRNVHLHNRGIVDAAYLGFADAPSFNVYGLADGDEAIIDAAYLESAHQLCRTSVERTAAWVGSLAHE